MKYISFLIAVFISFSASGQANLLEKRGGNYYYKGQKYQCDELSEVYEEYQVALDLYFSGRNSKRAANIVAITGVPFVLGGVLGLASGDFGGQIFGAFSLVAGSLLELVALIPRGIGGRKLRKARKIFNYEMIDRHGYNEDVSISFSQTPNGLGLVMNF